MMITFTPMATTGGNKGNFYYGARYYDPKISVWLSVDPMSSERPSLTPYNFVSNNPVMRVDPTGMLDDEWDYDLNRGELTWVSDKGGSETQYVNVKDGDKQVAQTSVSGSNVYAYKLKNSVFVTNTDRNFNDQTYNEKSGYEYNSEEFKLRDHYLSEDTPIRTALMSAESSGNAIPISYAGEENKDGYTVMRLKMMGAAIDQAWDVMPTPSPSVRRVGKLNIGSVGINPSVSPLKGYSGAKALSGSHSWNMFLKANTGSFSGQGWQKKAAAAYYKSKFHTP
jgi:RHS repeat-associated protein